MATVDDVQANFAQLFIKQIEDRLLDGSAAYLSFIAMFAGIKGLACFNGGVTRDANGGLVWNNADLFNGFVKDKRHFPTQYQSVDLWGLRNSLVHRFIPQKGFHLTVNDTAAHFKRSGGLVCLNADSFFADFKNAATAYFQRVRDDGPTASRFHDVCKEMGVLHPDAKFVYSGVANYGTNQATMVTISLPSPPLSNS